MRTFASSVPLSVVALAIAIVVSVAASGALARRLDASRWVAALVLLGFGFVLSATLVPTGAAFEGEASSGVCDFSRVGLASIQDLTRVTDVSLNVLLFIPLGVAVGLLPRNRAGVGVVVAAVSLTFIVEFVQLKLPAMGRGCETADMVDNSLGLALGVVMGLLIRLVVRGSRPIP